MRVKVVKRGDESRASLFRRFFLRSQKSGIALEVKKQRYRQKKLNKRAKWEAKMYRLKLQFFIEQKLKEGWDLEKALQMGRRYIQYIKYLG